MYTVKEICSGASNEIKARYGENNNTVKGLGVISHSFYDITLGNMRRIVLIGVICVVITSCGNRKASSNNAERDSLVVQEQKDSMEQSETLFDGDPNVSGSTEHIGAIMKSIADGDAKTLSSLTIYPIGRKYPLPNITSSSDMIKRFDEVFDQQFRDRMKSSKASDWHSYGWRGYSYGEDNALWVYDSLTIINYYSPQETALYDQLVKKEMTSLHKSLRGNGWYPFCCYKNLTDGSIVRIDIRARETMEEKNFHRDGVALAYPQLQPFKIRGDEEFRLSVYPKGCSLKEKPRMTLKGYVEIGGSANMMNYVFKNENYEIEFGDLFYEDGKQLLMIKKEDKETQHEIESCYWLDLFR